MITQEYTRINSVSHTAVNLLLPCPVLLSFALPYITLPTGEVPQYSSLNKNSSPYLNIIFYVKQLWDTFLKMHIKYAFWLIGTQDTRKCPYLALNHQNLNCELHVWQIYSTNDGKIYMLSSGMGAKHAFCKRPS